MTVSDPEPVSDPTRQPSGTTRVGVISDTHGLLRPEAIAALAGVSHILHAGDIGDPSILERLAEIAPVTAIRGNIDTHGPCAQLPATEYVTAAGHNIYILHNRADLDLNPRAASLHAVIYGHSHKPSIEHSQAILYFNPGSAGPRRFSLPISLGILELTSGVIHPHLITLL